MPIALDNTLTSGSAGTVQYSGLSSDTNWVDFVDDLMERERFHINQLNEWRADWSNKITALQGLDAKLLTLEDEADNLNSSLEFYSRIASSSDQSILTATATSIAVPGSHSITVGSNIKHQIASQGWQDQNTTAVGDTGGTFVIQVGTQGTITIDAADIDSSTTLADLRDLINNDAENTGNTAVTATIINDGSGTNPYRLALTADNGGPDYELAVNQNPTRLDYYENDISPADTSNLTGMTTSSIATAGSFTAAKSIIGTDGYRTYTFTGPASNETVGNGSWSISWSGDNGGGSGTIELGSTYIPGNSIELEDGVSIAFGEGVLEGGGTTFTAKAFSADIDDVESGTWSGTSTVVSDGNYLGSTNKTFDFTVAGTGTNTIGTDSFDVTWTDSEGNSGTISITDSAYTDLAVYQGVTVSFSAGTVTAGDTFSLDVYSSTVRDAAEQGLAQVAIQTHSGFVDANTTAVTSTSGTFSYTYGGVTRDISIAANGTLTTLRDLINNDEENPGVTAIILNDGSGLSTAYHLQLVGNNSGSMYQIENISHTLDNFAKDGTTGYGFSQTQRAQNAMLKVDGFPTDADEYIQRTSNSIGDIINGVTLNLMSAGTTNISITTDTEAIKAKIESLVDALNGVLDYVKAMMARVESGDQGYTGPMIGNYGFQIVQQRINSILSAPVAGLIGGTDTYTHISQIGIRTEDDPIKWASGDNEYAIPSRRWSIDSTALDNALNNNLDAVAALFVKDTIRGIDGIAELINEETENLTNVYNDVDPGIVSVLIRNYEGIIDNIDSKIGREERRLSLVENRLNARYSRLEAMLQQYKGQNAMLESMIKAMSSSNEQ